MIIFLGSFIMSRPCGGVARFPEYFLFHTNTFFLIVPQGLSSIFSTFFLVLEYFFFIALSPFVIVSCLICGPPTKASELTSF